MHYNFVHLSMNRAALRNRAFSLIEVVLAVGIVAIVLVPLFGLLPTGLNAHREAIDISVGSQIAQRIFNDALQTDFEKLGEIQTSDAEALYFDEQGNAVTKYDHQRLYRVMIEVESKTPIPSDNGDFPNEHLATVRITIKNEGSSGPDSERVYSAFIPRNDNISAPSP